jgi:hypothetical protein
VLRAGGVTCVCVDSDRIRMPDLPKKYAGEWI